MAEFSNFNNETLNDKYFLKFNFSQDFTQTQIITKIVPANEHSNIFSIIRLVFSYPGDSLDKYDVSVSSQKKNQKIDEKTKVSDLFFFLEDFQTDESYTLEYDPLKDEDVFDDEISNQKPKQDEITEEYYVNRNEDSTVFKEEEIPPSVEQKKGNNFSTNSKTACSHLKNHTFSENIRKKPKIKEKNIKLAKSNHQSDSQTVSKIKKEGNFIKKYINLTPSKVPNSKRRKMMNINIKEKKKTKSQCCEIRKCPVDCKIKCEKDCKTDCHKNIENGNKNMNNKNQIKDNAVYHKNDDLKNNFNKNNGDNDNRSNRKSVSCCSPNQMTAYLNYNTLRGLPNIGNTCYINTAIQIMFNFKEFNEFVMIFCDKYGEKFSKRSLLLTVAYRKLLTAYFAPTSTCSHHPTPSKVQKFLSTLDSEEMHRFKRKLSAATGLFHGYGQGDSTEVVMSILDKMNEEIGKFLTSEIRHEMKHLSRAKQINQKVESDPGECRKSSHKESVKSSLRTEEVYNSDLSSHEKISSQNDAQDCNSEISNDEKLSKSDTEKNNKETSQEGTSIDSGIESGEDIDDKSNKHIENISIKSAENDISRKHADDFVSCKNSHECSAQSSDKNSDSQSGSEIKISKSAENLSINGTSHEGSGSNSTEMAVKVQLIKSESLPSIHSADVPHEENVAQEITLSEYEKFRQDLFIAHLKDLNIPVTKITSLFLTVLQNELHCFNCFTSYKRYNGLWYLFLPGQVQYYSCLLYTNSDVSTIDCVATHTVARVARDIFISHKIQNRKDAETNENDNPVQKSSEVFALVKKNDEWIISVHIHSLNQLDVERSMNESRKIKDCGQVVFFLSQKSCENVRNSSPTISTTFSTLPSLTDQTQIVSNDVLGYQTDNPVLIIATISISSFVFYKKDLNCPIITFSCCKSRTMENMALELIKKLTGFEISRDCDNCGKNSGGGNNISNISSSDNVGSRSSLESESITDLKRRVREYFSFTKTYKNVKNITIASITVSIKESKLIRLCDIFTQKKQDKKSTKKSSVEPTKAQTDSSISLENNPKRYNPLESTSSSSLPNTSSTSSVKVNSLKKSSEQKNPIQNASLFKRVSIPIKTTSKNLIHDLLNIFLQDETLDGVKCSTCIEHDRTEKSETIDSSQIVLTEPKVKPKAMMMKKSVIYPGKYLIIARSFKGIARENLYIEIKRDNPSNSVHLLHYTLISSGNHLGYDNIGHYIAYIKKESVWCCNDTMVSDYDEMAKGYLLVYECVGEILI